MTDIESESAEDMSSCDANYERDSHDEGEDDLASIVGSDDENVTLYTSEVKKMLTVYERGVKVIKSQTVKTEILRLVRKIVIPHEKFITEGSYIGSFERPDFTDKETWYSIVLSEAGYNQHKARTLAKVWVTYRGDVSEVFSNHRSYVTQTMKKAFLLGEYIHTSHHRIVSVFVFSYIQLTYTNNTYNVNFSSSSTYKVRHWIWFVIISH